jgi:phosphoenolpyruvate synthase/pyruvate phosphate dikinase
VIGGIIYAQIWHAVFTKEFRKQIGWGYTEVVFEGKDNTVSIYRASKEHIDGMRDFILGRLDKNDSWLKKQAEFVEEKVDNTINWVNKIRGKNFSEYSDKELGKILQEFVDRNIELGPAFIMMLWFPIQMEQHPQLEKYKEAVETAVGCREKIEKIGPLVDTFGREISVEALKRADIENDYSKFITYQEILEFFNKGTKFNEYILNSRKKYFLVTKKGILSESLEKYLANCRYTLEETKLIQSDTIKGRTAYPGLVKGIVKIVNNKEAFEKMNKGDILVTGMTTPDFLPVIEKSAGFITDEGGITCHAAIVSRELKKPCIIGTKIATKVLKDGDIVKVDADKGIIMIIKKA